VQPTNAPPLGDPSDSGLPYTTVGSTVYQFIERAAPTIEEWYVDEANPSVLGWQSVDVATPVQLSNWVDGATNWTYTGSGTLFNKNT
jgi:hypothetical protein